MRVRKVINNIFFLVNDRGEKLIKNDDIKEEIIFFYKGFMGFVV